MLTAQHILLIEGSFADVKPIGSAVAALFYERLFSLDPALRPLFRGDMAEQGRKLITMLTVVVNGIQRLDALMPAVEELGRRHASYGVTDGHYKTVGSALLWTLEQGLGDAFTADVREAWTAAYTLLASAMKRAVGSPVATAA